MKKKIGDYEIPFDSKGNQLQYVDSWSLSYRGVKMTPNFEFTDNLTYKGFHRGRSAANFTFVRSDGTEVSVFMTDMDEFIPHMVAGVIHGRFTFQKRGQNYGCTLVEKQ